MTAVHLSRQKELDPDPKAIQQIEFVGKLKNADGVNVDMFVLTIWEKNWKKNLTKNLSKSYKRWAVMKKQELHLQIIN